MAERTCEISECGGAPFGRGWCHLHYLRWWRHGDPRTLLRDPAAKRAWLTRLAASPPTGRCVDWPWGVSAQGYGMVQWEGTQRQVPGVVLEITGRPRPPAPANHSLHSCDRHVCCAPWHLRWGSHAENMADMTSRGRNARGTSHGQARLTEPAVLSIRSRHALGGVSVRALAAEFGVSNSAIWHVVQRRTWTHVG